MLGLQITAYAIGLPLDLMILVVLLRGQWRQYPFAFAYVAGDFLTSVLEIQPGLHYETASVQARKSFLRLYWWDERVMQVLVFLLIVSLIYRAVAHLEIRYTLLAGVVCAILVLAGGTFFFYYDPSKPTGRWIVPWLRNLNFCAAMLNLSLWGTLISSPRKDYRLLMLSGALGIQFTGGAVGQAIRIVSHSSAQLASYSISISNLICLYIFWRAFRMPDAPPDVEREPPV
jgi:hypothetical protein